MPIIGMVKLHQSELNSTSQRRMIDTEARSTAAKRCLFERPDHGQLMQQVMKELEDQQEEDRHRWNFDFKTGKPLPGRYQWTPVSRPTIGFISSAVKRPRLDACSSSVDTTDMPKLISSKDSCIQTKITAYMKTRKTSTSRSPSPKAPEDADPVKSSLGEDVESGSQ